MRQERIGPQFAAENQRMASDILGRAASIDATGVDARQGAATAFEQSYEAAALRHAVVLERERVDHRPSGKRNDPADPRPFLRSVMSEQRWGPRPALPDPKAAEDAMRAQIQERIAELLKARANAMAGGPIEAELRALQQRLDALPTTK